MNKQEFLELLRKSLSGLPNGDLDERLTFYSEMIDDRIEEGLAEEEAVLAVGPVDKIVTQTIADTPFAKLAKERIKPKRHMKAWEIVLLALGSPIWLSLGIAALAVILSLYVSLWSVLISLWSVFVSFAACSFGCIVSGIIIICNGDTFSGVACISVGIACAGISIFTFYGCKAVTKGVNTATKKIAVLTKRAFIKRREA